MTLIALNVLAFAYTLSLTNLPSGAPQALFLDSLALNPRAPVSYTFLTYAFLHAGWLHILGNMLLLWVFGPNLEDRLGRPAFAALYVLGAIAAGALHALVQPNPVVGASGAVAALTGAYLVLFPRTLVRCLLFFILIGIYSIPAWWFVAFALAKDLFQTATGSAGNVATLAHLGGYAFGILFAALALASRLLPREDYDLVYAYRQWQRRRDIRAAARSATIARGHLQRDPGTFANPASSADAASRNAPSRSRSSSARTAAPSPFFAQRADPNDDPALDPQTAALARRRADILRALAEQRPTDAADAWQQLLTDLGLAAPPAPPVNPASSPGSATDPRNATDPDAPGPALATLPRRQQLELANHLLALARHRPAARAYELFVQRFPADPETPRVLLMTALIAARHLADPARAKAALRAIPSRLTDPDQDALARQLAIEVGAITSPQA